jgi:hypothetical protein
MKLEVPLDDMTLTLRDAITRRVQWRRTAIDVDPSAIASTSTTCSQPHTTPGSILLEAQLDSPIRDQLCCLHLRLEVPPLPAPDQT